MRKRQREREEGGWEGGRRESIDDAARHLCISRLRERKGDRDGERENDNETGVQKACKRRVRGRKQRQGQI